MNDWAIVKVKCHRCDTIVEVNCHANLVRQKVKATEEQIGGLKLLCNACIKDEFGIDLGEEEE